MVSPLLTLDALGNKAGEAAAQHMWHAFRVLFKEPKGRPVEVGDDYILLHTGEPHPLANFAIFVSDDDPERVARIAQPLVDLPAPSAILFPVAQMSDAMTAGLNQMGYEQEHPIPAMAVDTAKLTPTEMPSSHQFVRAERKDAQQWIDALAAGYELPPICSALFYPPDHVDPKAIQCYAAVGENGVDAVSLVCCAEGIAGIYCVATRHDARGKGLGAHLTAEPLRIAARDGYRVGVLQASPKGLPVYERLGFETCGAVQCFVRVPK